MTTATPRRDLSHELIAAYYEVEEGYATSDDALVERGMAHLAEVATTLTRFLSLATESDDPNVAREARETMMSVSLVFAIFEARQNGAELDPVRPANELLQEIASFAGANAPREQDPEGDAFAQEASRRLLNSAAEAMAADADAVIDQVAAWVPPTIVAALRAERHALRARGHRATVVARAARQRRRHAPRRRSSRRCSRRGPPARAREDDEPDPPRREPPQ